MQAYLLSSKDLSDSVYQSLYAIRNEDNFHFRSLLKYSPKESNLMSSDISRFTKTVETELHIDYPENNSRELDMMESNHRYLHIREASCHWKNVQYLFSKPVTGIEPVSTAWKAVMLILYTTRTYKAFR